MADNPLYPGQMPKKDAYNPLYPGYYPGQPMPKRPKPSGFIKPVEFNVMGFSQLVNEDDILEAAGPLKGPAWLKDRVVADWKQQMQAQVYGGQVDQSEIDDFNTDTLPGASGVGISLAPEDWKDPKKLLKDTAVSWVKIATGLDVSDLTKSNFGDFANRVRAEIWENALGFDVKESAAAIAQGIGTDTLKVAAAEALAEATLERNRPGREAPMSPGVKAVLEPDKGDANFHALNINPMKVKISVTEDDGQGGTRVVQKSLVEHYDLDNKGTDAYDSSIYKSYKNLGGKVKDFELNQAAAFFRDSKYSDTLKSALDALHTSFYGKEESFEDDKIQQKYQNLYQQRTDAAQQAAQATQPASQASSSATPIPVSTGPSPRVVVSSATAAAPAATPLKINLSVGAQAEAILARARANGVSEAEINVMRNTIDKLHAQKIIADSIGALGDKSDAFTKGIGAINLGDPGAKDKVTSRYSDISKTIKKANKSIEEFGDKTGINISEYKGYVKNLEETLSKQVLKNSDGLANRLSQYNPSVLTAVTIDKDFHKAITGAEISDERIASWSNRAGKALTKEQAILMDLGLEKDFSEHLGNIDTKLKAFNTAFTGASGNKRDEVVKGAFDDLVSTHKDALSELRNMATAKFPSLQGDEALKKLIASNPGLQEYHNMLTSLDKTLADHISANSLGFHTSLKSVTSEKIAGGITGRTLKQGSIFQSNIERKFLQESMEYGLCIAGGPGGSLDNIGSIIFHMGLDPNDVNLPQKVRAIVRRIQVERSAEAISEFMDAVQKGPERVWTNYVYNPYIKPRLENFTPAIVAQKFLSKNHYFGLKIDEKYVSNAQKNSALFNKLYQYKFKIKVDGVKYTFLAGDHFSSVTRIHDFLIKNPGMAMDLLSGKKLIDLAGSAGMKTDDIITIQKGIDKFLDWAKNHAKNTGNANFTDSNFLFKLVKSLHREATDSAAKGIGITKQYIGGIERVFVGLNKIQKYILNSKVGKLLVKYYNVTRLVTERVAKMAAQLVAKGITWLLGRLTDVASGGTLVWLTPILQKVIEPIIRFILNKTVGYAKAMFAGFLKGDWTAMIRTIEAEVQKTAKFVILALGVPIGALMMVIMAFLMVIGTAISPLDPFKSNSGYGGGGPGWPPGENAVVKVTKDVEVTAGGTTYTNPARGTITNDMVDEGITVVYKVKITPKVTVTDASVTWFDLANARTTDTSFEVMARPQATINPFVEGTTYEFILPDDLTIPNGTLILQGAEYHNSLVTNIAAVNTPAIGSMGIEVGVAAFARSFSIGDYVPDCPLGLTPEGYHIMTTSYTGSIGHGTDNYWTNICTTMDGTVDQDCLCNYPIPWVWYRNGCATSQYTCSPSDPTNYCTEKYPDNPSPYYGFALDVAPNDPDNGRVYEVTLPTVAPSWTLQECGLANFQGSWGYGQIWSSDDGLWKLYFTHLAQGCPGGVGMQADGGDVIGTLFTGWASDQLHVHIELIAIKEGTVCAQPNANGCGIPKRPECYMCAEGGGANCN